MKVIINRGIGFTVSREVFSKLNLDWDDFGYIAFALNLSENGKEFRTHNGLIKAIEELGKRANFEHSDLNIIEIPDNVDFIVEELSAGGEIIHEKHRTWM